MSTVRLSDTSHAVLALLERFGPATPYRLKQIAQVSLFHFWSIPHTQLYTECERLAKTGLLDESRERGGRRRRVYALAPAGRRALAAWRDDPDTDLAELRDPALLKLFSGADPAALAASQLPRHEQRLREYEELLERGDLPDAARLTLEAGIGHAREYVRFWSRLHR